MTIYIFCPIMLQITLFVCILQGNFIYNRYLDIYNCVREEFMKTGIIDVGGGLRGIYAAGVLDFCIKKEISFDYCIGISAGSANLTSYLAQQYQRNYKFYREYSFRKEYMGFRTWLHTGSFIDMDYVYGTLSNSTGEYPLDYPKIKNRLRLLNSPAPQS